jgi:multidrug efflux pump subunit AcrA (membrane-fusion protein)
MSFALISFNLFAESVPLKDRTEFKWEKVVLGKEVSSFPVPGVVIAEEGALHMQSARIGGRILSLLNEEGGLVKRGVALFTVTGPECVSIRQEKRIAVNSKLEDLVSSIKVREHELNIRVTDNECLVLADAHGVLVKRSVGSGSSFAQGDVLAQILENDRMRIELEVPERSVGAISKGTTVKFRMPSAPGFTGSSVIQQVFPIVEEGSRVMKARLHRANLPPDTKLNSMVFAEIQLSQNHPCLVVPNTAVTFQDNGSWVIVKTANGLERISVLVIGNDGGKDLINPLIKDKLKEGDMIATYNVPFLYQEVKTKHSNKK